MLMDGCTMDNSWLISSNIRAWVVAIIDLRGLTIKFVDASLFCYPLDWKHIRYTVFYLHIFNVEVSV